MKEPVPDGRGSVQPSVILSLGLLALTILAWPGLVQRFISLDWQIGNMRPWFLGAQAALGVATIVCWTARHRVDDALRRAFPTRRRLAFTVVALLGSGAATWAAAEVVLRFARWPFQARVYTAANAMARFDPDTGWSYIPNRSVVRVAGSERKPITYHFDRFGTRVGAAGLQRDPTRPSLPLLGCSFTFGEAVPYEETFAAQLEARPGFPLQVVNGGVGGFGAGQTFQMMKRFLNQFPVRAVVYTFMAEHPTRDAASDRRLFHPEERFRATAPKFALRPDGAVYIEKPAQRLEDLVQSQVWAGFRVAWFRKGPPPSLALTRALVLAMKEYAESRGVRFYLLDWAQGPSSAPQSCFADLPVRLVDTRLQQPPGWDTWLVPGDGHPDRRAHTHVAGLLAARLAQEAGH